jgi:hypothetical protein
VARVTLASTKTHLQTLLETLIPGLSRTAAEEYCLGSLFGAYFPTSSVLKWIRRYATTHGATPEPTGNAIVLERDEMWHFLKKTPEALDLEGSCSCYRTALGLGVRAS